MKHNTHIYIASKAIELLRDSLDNLVTMTGQSSQADKRPLKAKAKLLQRLLLSHAGAGAILEASWAPDDILNDKVRFHTFKLYTPAILPERAEAYRAQTYKNKKYYRGAGGGGLPYKVDHLAALISDLQKLRAYNDNFSVRELTYLYLLISHYVVDAHVPMHCDLRDDPPTTKTQKTKPGPAARYFKKSLHGQVEAMWDRAATPVAVAEGIVVAETYKDQRAPNALSPHVTFNPTRRADRAKIRPVLIPDGALMEFMINRCVASYERSLAIWPPNKPASSYATANVTPDVSNEIFADSIAAVISVWMSI